MLPSPFSELSCSENTVWISSRSHQAGRKGLEDDFAPCEDWSFLSDSASAARQGRATKNEKMSSRCTSRLTLQSGLQALRELGKHVAASEQELPRWWSPYAPVSFLIAFWSTLCTMCTLVHYVHSCTLCALCALKDTILSKVHNSTQFCMFCHLI